MNASNTALSIPTQHMTDSAAVISMIAEASRDPQVNIDKLERLILMKERIEATSAERSFDSAMTKAQSEMRAVVADRNNSQTRSQYASYYALDKAIRPIYTNHGFNLSFNQGETVAEKMVRVICRVAHSAGHRERYHIDMPGDGLGAKGAAVMTLTHATGSAVTYGRRYLLLMIWNLSIGGDGSDDDGNGANGDIVSSEQALAIQKLIDETGSDIKKFLSYFKCTDLGLLPGKHYLAAIKMLEMKRKVKE